tara:strand:+ start:7881 stop:8900 length:1020 start_codon:yes stop_codon:yes gene_type:complete
MAVPANTSETYDNKVIREDLQEAYTMISPEETPFQMAVRTETASNTLFEWPVVELAAVDSANRVIEGEAAPGNDAPTLASRFSNYTQISDKVASVSHSAQSVDAAAQNIQRLSQQIVIKMKEMKRDKETMLLSNIAAAAGSSGTARATAGLPAWLSTNSIFETGGADPTLSGTTEGFPNVAAVAASENAGASVLFAEANLNTIIENIWNEGGNPSLIMVNSGNKRRISSAFSGNSTRYKDVSDKTVINSVDFYDSDFGELTVVPNRFMPTNNPAGNDDSYNVLILDPEYAAVAYLDEVQQKPLAETGHSMQTLVWCEYGLQMDNEKAHGIIRDTTNAIA